ncbi:MAG: hypothetical protein U9R16_06550 [Campylobacterota bacterium]|nr:hypothetical protein [Campylobacterota bacterium]
MERRNRSLEALKRLRYIDSLESTLRADSLVDWMEQYFCESSIEEFDLEIKDLKQLSELFYKNISFLKQHRIDIKAQLDSHHKIKEFLH